jgi:hypothetical protein
MELAMRNRTITPGLTLALSIFGIACLALPSYALTAPALKVDVGTGSVTIDATGAQTYSGLCSALLCPGTVTLGTGTISWSGTIGDFGISTLTGRTKPSLGSPNIDLGIGAITTGLLGGQITLSWTDVGFTVGSSPGTMNIVPGGVGSAVYTSYVDNTNIPFGQGIKVGTTPNGGIVSGSGPSTSPFSMTNVEVLTMPINLGIDLPPFNNDFSLQAAPNPPLTLSCGLAGGRVNLAYSSGLVANGGVAPYNFSIVPSPGPLPGGLSINPITGVISGTPTTAATFNFTAQLVDSSGSTGANTVTAPCSVLIAPPPPPTLTLTCPATTTGQVGSPFNSSLVGLGGLGSYTFSLVGGTLPANVNLNLSTGSISGTPTGSGSFTYTAQVKDSNTPAATATTGSCTVTIAPAPVGSIGDRVWSDTNNNGLQDSGDPGLTGWTVTLKNSGGSTVATAVTGANGAYSFGNLTAGTYTVCVAIQANFTETFDLDGRSTANCATGVLTAGQNRTDFDFGYVPVAQAAALTLTCATGTAEVGVPYSSAVVPSGGVGPYTYSISSGALPGGLTLNASSGAITGTPTTTGTSGFTVKVVDSKGTAAFSSCTGTCSAGTISSTINFNTSTGSLGNSKTYSVSGATVTAYGYSNSGSPAAIYAQNNYGTSTDGIGIDSVYNNQIDSVHFIQLDLSQAIAAGATGGQILISGLTQCQYGESYDIYGSNTPGMLGTQLVAAGTKDTTFFAIPSFGTYKYISVRAHSGNVLIGQLSFNLPTSCSIKVAAALHVTCPSSSATVGKSYSSPVVASGGTSPYTYSVSWGSLPAGLTLNGSTGVISGTPTTSQTGAFQIKVVDAAGAVGYSNSSGSCSNGTSISYGQSGNQNNDGDRGVSSTYSSNGLSMTLYGFDTHGNPATLHANNSWNNSGMGIKGSNSNQIDTGHFVQCDIGGHISSGATGASVYVGTQDWNASYDVYGSNTLGSLGTLLVNNASPDSNTPQAIPNFANYRYICVKAHSGNVVVGTVNFNYASRCAIDVGQSSYSGYGSYGASGYGGGNSGGGYGGSGSGQGGCW